MPKDQLAEIAILRDEDALFLVFNRENLFVWQCLRVINGHDGYVVPQVP